MMRLKSKLLSLNATKTDKVKVFTPANCEEVRIPFKVDKVAKVVGRLAQVQPPEGADDPQLMAGVLVQNGFKLSLMAPDDLREYAGLTTTTVTCKQHLTLSSASMDLVRWALEGTFGAIEEVRPRHTNGKVENETGSPGDDKNPKAEMEEAVEKEFKLNEVRTYLIMGCIFLRYTEMTREVELEWEGNMMNDGVADAVMAVLLTVESSPASVKRELSFAAIRLHTTTLDGRVITWKIAEFKTNRYLLQNPARINSTVIPTKPPSQIHIRT
jgi:cleavage and polyadenylation specificity factor subunit 3